MIIDFLYSINLGLFILFFFWLVVLVFVFLNFVGINSEISIQLFNFLILVFIISTPSSVVQTGSLGILTRF